MFAAGGAANDSNSGGDNTGSSSSFGGVSGGLGGMSGIGMSALSKEVVGAFRLSGTGAL